MRNVFHIEADYKVQKQVQEPVVTQNDAVTFNIAILNNGLPYPLDGMSEATLAHKRPDGKVVVTLGELYGDNVIRFDVGGSEFAVVGTVEATVQLYGLDGRASTLRLTYRVIEDPTGTGYIPSESEKTLIEIVLVQGPIIIAEAKAAADAADAAALRANTSADTADAAALRANASADKADASSASADAAALKANTAADNATQTADAAAKYAKDTADAAALNANNSATAANEAATKATTSAGVADAAAASADSAASDARTATTTVQLLIDELRSAASYDRLKQYKKNNIVEYYGSSFIALKDTIGVEPPDLTVAKFNESWYLVAQRGVDGKGSIVTINGKGPDANGNVVIEIPSPVVDYSELQNIPTEFNPKAHTHAITEVTGLEAKISELETLIANIVSTGVSRLARYHYHITGILDGQSTIEIPLTTFAEGDVLIVTRNTTFLNENEHYTVTGRTITLTKPVVTGATTTFFLLILKLEPLLTTKEVTLDEQHN